MSNNFQNLFIILALAGLILYISNMRQKRYENFSVLNKLISGIDNMSEAELQEYEKKIAQDNEEEKLIDELNKASKLIGEEEDDDEDELKPEVLPVEEEEQYAMIEEEMNEEEFKRKLAAGTINSNITGEKLTQEEIFSENIAEKQLEEEEEFRKFLGGEMKNLPESEEEENGVIPFAEEENAFNLAEEENVQEEIRQRLIHQEEEEMSRKRAAERLQQEESILDEQFAKNRFAQEEMMIEEERLDKMRLKQKQLNQEMMVEEERLDRMSKNIVANQEFLQELPLRGHSDSVAEELLEEERMNHMRARQRIIAEEEELLASRHRNQVSMEEEYNHLQEEEEEDFHLQEEERDRYLAEEAKHFDYMEEEGEERYRLSEEIMAPEAKQEMKNRMKYQVNCGTFIDPKYKKRIEGCGTKAYMKLKKPFNKKLNDIMHNRNPNAPKPIKQIYDELTAPEIDRNATSLCQHVQKGMSMGSCSKSFQVIGEEDEGITDSLRANDTCFDPYSNY